MRLCAEEKLSLHLEKKNNQCLTNNKKENGNN